MSAKKSIPIDIEILYHNLCIYIILIFVTIQILGYNYEDFKFEYKEGTTPNYGCSVILNGQFWYMGGISQGETNNRPHRQVSHILFDRIKIFILKDKQNSWL